MGKYLIIALVLIFVVYLKITSDKKRKQKLEEARERNRLIEEEQQRAALEYDNSIAKRIEEIKSSQLQPVDAGSLLLKKGEICYVNDSTPVQFGNSIGHDSIIVTNRRAIIMNRQGNLETKEALVLLKDVVSVSTFHSYVFGWSLSVEYYSGETGKVGSISIHTKEDARIIEAIIKKVVSESEDEES